jgi:hypothetical protein
MVLIALAMIIARDLGQMMRITPVANAMSLMTISTIIQMTIGTDESHGIELKGRLKS